MITPEDIRAIILYMKGSYPNYSPLLDGEINSVDILFDQLRDLPKDLLCLAVKAACAEPGRIFAPSTGEIREKVAELQGRANNVPNMDEAWGAIMQSFSCVRSQRPSILEHPIVKKVIHCMGGLERIGMSENNMADRAHFMRIFAEVRDREMRQFVELPEVSAYIEQRRLLTDGIISGLAKRLSDGNHRLPDRENKKVGM